jgi:ubiquinone/menaquinone biosynthesis C-methylase UbiE
MVFASLRAVLEERLVLMAPARRLRLALADRALSRFAAGRSIKVLDAGCGDGLLSLAIAHRHRDWSVVGVDLREDLLAGARARAAAKSIENVRFVQGDLTEPIPEAGFDAVMAVECLSEIPDDESALRTMAAALSPGGLLVAQVPDSSWRPIFSGSATTWREQVRQGYSPEGLADVLHRVGLAGVEVAPTYRSLAAAAQELRDRIKDSALPIRLLAFPLLAAAAWLERVGLTWGRPNAMLAQASRRSD